MIENLSICHVEKHREDAVSCGEAAQWALFETCQRKVFISMVSHTPRPDNLKGEVLRGEAAYSLLLNIVCGLQSKVVGETEVLGQFKIFANSEPADQPIWFKQFRRVAQDILVDAKEIRSVYLHSVGHRSYGALTASHLKNCESTAIIGGGQLARKALPYLNDRGQKLCLFLRDPSRAAQIPARMLKNVNVKSLGEQGDLSGVKGMVVAAPMSSRAIASWMKSCNFTPDMVVDLRDQNAHERLSVSGKLITLDDLFANIETVSEAFEERIRAAKNRISHLARERSFVRHYRPFGWEDICT